MILLLVAGYVSWLAGRLGRLHRRAEAATAALDAKLVRRAAAAAVLADQLSDHSPQLAADLYAAARAALAAGPVEREAAENDLTRTLRELPETISDLASAAAAWSDVVTASRRVALARQVHTDLVRDARAVRSRIAVKLLRLAQEHAEPAYFDVDDPALA